MTVELNKIYTGDAAETLAMFPDGLFQPARSKALTLQHSRRN